MRPMPGLAAEPGLSPNGQSHCTAWKPLGWSDPAELGSDVPQLTSRKVISLSQSQQEIWRSSLEQPRRKPSPPELLPAGTLTLSSKVKQTRCGYSVSATTTPASPSFRTYTWQRYSGQRIRVREAAGRCRGSPSSHRLPPGPGSSSPTHELHWKVSFRDSISHYFIRKRGKGSREDQNQHQTALQRVTAARPRGTTLNFPGQHKVKQKPEGEALSLIIINNNSSLGGASSLKRLQQPTPGHTLRVPGLGTRSPAEVGGRPGTAVGAWNCRAEPEGEEAAPARLPLGSQLLHGPEQAGQAEGGGHAAQQLRVSRGEQGSLKAAAGQVPVPPVTSPSVRLRVLTPRLSSHLAP